MKPKINIAQWMVIKIFQLYPMHRRSVSLPKGMSAFVGYLIPNPSLY